MKKLRLLILLCVALFSVACSYNELPDNLQPAATLEDKITLNIETRAETYKGEQLDQKYFVTAADLENFVNFRRTESKRFGFSVKEVKSYGFDSSQTLFYILNYDKGWEVVAADKRVQPTLAHGDEGTFTMDTDNEPMKFWMNMLADGVLQTRRDHEYGNSGGGVSTASTTSTNTTNSTLSAQNDNVDFWDSISSDEATRPGGLIPTPGPMQPVDGLYTYTIDTEIVTKTYTYGPYLVTKWGQSSPWNKFCPLKTDDSGERAPAGCVAVAGAQMMYYLKHHFEMDDIYAPATATCSGTINDYQREFANFSTSTWNSMATRQWELPITNRDITAAFIGYIGGLSEVTYGNDGSGASMNDLSEHVFNFYGISHSQNSDYDSDIIIENIKNELPVVISGYTSLLPTSGHAWIVDGYEKQVRETTSYIAVFDSPQTEPFLAMLDKEDANLITTNTQILSETLSMNWGWSGFLDGSYSTIPEEWIPESEEVDEDALLYNYWIELFYNFRLQ